ncbi:hypothetical protein [Bradyrhizobium diazoefficiens]|uniref:hypothetical protein n=1 Tax=Bradyrhizobium diazoefficiens TaxID=1355477 RepID=UPI0004BAF51B|nr:hypothetical protein [Bradyrhizobium diazoefficiens]
MTNFILLSDPARTRVGGAFSRAQKSAWTEIVKGSLIDGKLICDCDSSSEPFAKRLAHRMYGPQARLWNGASREPGDEAIYQCTVVVDGKKFFQLSFAVKEI